MNVRKQTKAELTGRALSGAWREDPQPADLSAAELEIILPLLLKSGAAALCWRRVRGSKLENTSAGNELHQSHRYQTLQTRVAEPRIERVVTGFRSAGIEPILVKGWSIARQYPERGVRPYGDIDVCVSGTQYAATRPLLETSEELKYYADLQNGFDNLGGGSWDDLFARSELVQLGETKVRILAPEDHFRVLCFHMLREGAWRPLWLCDIAVALEFRPATFDWEKCFGGSNRTRKLVTCAALLAHRLLDARIEGTPFESKPGYLPGWVISTVLKEWESPEPSMARRHMSPATNFFRRPSRVRSLLTDRWPNPVEASVVARAPFNEFPRLPFQMGTYLIRAFAFVRRLPSLWRSGKIRVA